MKLLNKQKLDKDVVVSHFLSMSKSELDMRFMRPMGRPQIEMWWEDVVNKSEVKHLFCVEEFENQLVGMGQLSFHKDSLSGELAVSISPDFRGQRLSKKLLGCLIEQAKGINLSEIVVLICHSNQPMIKIIKEMGFKTRYVEGDFMGVLEI